MNMRRVVVTDADGPTASILVSALKRKGHHVTALTDEIANLEADRIIPKWTLSDQARFALQSADVVIWLGRTYFLARAAFEREQIRVADFVARGLERGTAKRLLLLGRLLTNAKQVDKSFGAQREAELLLEGCTPNSLILRTGLLLGDGQRKSAFERALTGQTGKSILVPGRPDDRHRPLSRKDLVEALENAVVGDQTGDCDLHGSTEVTTREIIQLVNPGKQVKVRYRSPFMFRAFSPASKWALLEFLAPMASSAAGCFKEIRAEQNGLQPMIGRLRAGGQ